MTISSALIHDSGEGKRAVGALDVLGRTYSIRTALLFIEKCVTT